jgi:FMN phosphatase YigB (HAD superfamily)
MIGDRMIDDISGALGVGMRAVWKANTSPWPRPEHIEPTATVTCLAELPPLVEAFRR